jgi:hypothetical protein
MRAPELEMALWDPGEIPIAQLFLNRQRDCSAKGIGLDVTQKIHGCVSEPRKRRRMRRQHVGSILAAEGNECVHASDQLAERERALVTAM